MSTYTIIDTTPAVYQDKLKGIVNGVLVRFRIDQYDEVHEVRVPELRVDLVKDAIEKVITERDQLAGLGKAS